MIGKRGEGRGKGVPEAIVKNPQLTLRLGSR